MFAHLSLKQPHRRRGDDPLLVLQRLLDLYSIVFYSSVCYHSLIQVRSIRSVFASIYKFSINCIILVKFR